MYKFTGIGDRRELLTVSMVNRTRCNGFNMQHKKLRMNHREKPTIGKNKEILKWFARKAAEP